MNQRYWAGFALLFMVVLFPLIKDRGDERLEYLLQTRGKNLTDKAIEQEKILPDQEVDSRIIAVSGHITVVDYYVDSCGGCRLLAKHYKTFVRLRPDVAIRRIRMPDDWNPSWANKRYGLDIRATPHIVIFATDGNVLAQDSGKNKEGFELLYKWMNSELEYKYNLN